MSDYDIHSCGYYCDRHACIVAQRDELRDKLFEGQAVKTYSGGKPNYTQPEPEQVAWDVWTVHNYIFFSIGVQTFQISDVLEHEPEVSAKEFSKWLAIQLRHALTQLSNTAPPQRDWVGLTDEEIESIYAASKDVNYEYERAIEAKLKEKNNG